MADTSLTTLYNKHVYRYFHQLLEENNILYWTGHRETIKTPILIVQATADYITCVDMDWDWAGSGHKEAKGKKERVGWRDVVANLSPLFKRTILHQYRTEFNMNT